MAGKSSKKQAQVNKDSLKNLYKFSVPIMALSLLRTVYSRGSLFKYVLLHLPMLFCTYALEKSGRPQYDVKGKLVKEGIDLQQPGGLTEYMFDLIYLSLFGDLGRVLLNTNKFWYVLLLCPVYIGYKLYGLKQQFMPSAATAAASHDTAATSDAKSKRQMKREKRGDKPQYKYR